VANVTNYGVRRGAAVHPAKCLENLVDKNIPWVHLGIAGPTSSLEINNYSKKFMNPFGVRLLFDYLKNI